jgi:hypothetical protein
MIIYGEMERMWKKASVPISRYLACIRPGGTEKTTKNLNHILDIAVEIDRMLVRSIRA